MSIKNSLGRRSRYLESYKYFDEDGGRQVLWSHVLCVYPWTLLTLLFEREETYVIRLPTWATPRSHREPHQGYSSKTTLYPHQIIKPPVKHPSPPLPLTSFPSNLPHRVPLIDCDIHHEAYPTLRARTCPHTSQVRGKSCPITPSATPSFLHAQPHQTLTSSIAKDTTAMAI